MASYDEAVVAARQRMIEALAATGTSERTLEAFRRVPRDRLVPRFWTLPSDDGVTRAEHRRGNTDGLAALYDIDRAVAVNRVVGAPGGTTSTASAPRLLAAQADLLALEPGMSVLEIGTGPGYFAAILSELVGPTGRVVTIDIDARVTAAARVALRETGYGNVAVHTGDGHRGMVAKAPYDRVIASVGCADVAAGWLAQLAKAGFALIPVRHGAVHPTMRVAPDGAARVVARSGYVEIQGAQAGARPWPHARSTVPVPNAVALPEAMHLGTGRTVEWDLGMWVALHDDRAGFLVRLNDGRRSSARVDSTQRTLESGGPAGAELGRALLAHAHTWIDAGRPGVESHRHRFVPLGVDDTKGPRVIRRVDHAQLVTLGTSSDREV